MLDLNVFYAAVRKSAALPETTTGANLHAAIRPFFAKAAGVNLDPRSGRGFIFSDSLGEIKIYATLPELDAIEALLQPLTGPPVVFRFFHLAPDFLAKATNGLTPEISSVFTTNPAAGFRALLESTDSRDPRPQWLKYVQERGFVVVRATDADLDKFESTIKPLVDQSSSIPFRTVPASTNTVAAVKSLSTNSNQPQTKGPLAPLTNGVQQVQAISQATGKGREAISQQLEQIKFDKVLYRELPLFEVVRSLNDEARLHDPDLKGVNFIVDPNVPGSTNQISLTNCPTINMDQAAIGITLRDTLDAIVKGASAKIHYSIEDYAVIFGLGEPVEPIQTRHFKIDLKVISAALGVPLPAEDRE